MIVGIMQPYFFPYLGYWQHMNAVDKYVIYNDVNYIKGGRINRNNILINSSSQQINLILQGASPNKLIKDVKVDTSRRCKDKLIKTIEMAYHKAPFFDSAMPLIEKVILLEDAELDKYLYNSFIMLGDYLSVNTELIVSSDLTKDNNLHGHKKVIDIVKRLGGDQYYNSISGIPLYRPYYEEFKNEGIELNFTCKNEIIYKQFNDSFVDNLSIIDVMMFNSRNRCKELLSEYHLIGGNSND